MRVTYVVVASTMPVCLLTLTRNRLLIESQKLSQALGEGCRKFGIQQ